MIQTAVLHGRSVAYVEAGQGPVLLLIHGMAGDWQSWRPVIEPLAESQTVIAPISPGTALPSRAPAITRWES